MNRILTADVILTLTVEQAMAVASAISMAESSALIDGHRDDAAEFGDLYQVVRAQCAKQGVDA